MYKFCIFGGTDEGRRLTAILAKQPVCVTVCVATDYGKSLIECADNVVVSAKRLSVDEMTAFMDNKGFDLVIDATHPYATEVTENIIASCKKTKTEYVRLLREVSEKSSDCVYVSDVSAAVKFLNTTEGNVFLTTGSKDIAAFAEVKDFDKRFYARVLPNEASISACINSGIRPQNIIAAHGPFSEEMNTAMFKFTSAEYLVTKDGGESGGFAEKISAAKKSGVKTVVISRPTNESGFVFSELIDFLAKKFGFEFKPEVSIVGIGPSGTETMTAEAVAAIKSANCVIGAERMIKSVSLSDRHTVYAEINPEKIAELIYENRNLENFAVLMSGDSCFYSGTKRLVSLLDNCEVKIVAGINSLSYFCSRLKISYEDIKTVSLHGRECGIIFHVLTNFRVFTLVGGENGVNKLCDRLLCSGLDEVKLYVGERLGYDNEKIIVGTAKELSDKSFDKLSVVLIENPMYSADFEFGIPDNEFNRGTANGKIIPMTKSEVRTLCIAKLRPDKNSICWDIGSGSGSVAIETALKCEYGKVFAVEKNLDAASLINENKAKFGIENLSVICGTAPNCCVELPNPTRVFIGGSSGEIKEIIKLALQKNPNVRIVATAITLETAAELTECIKELEFDECEVVSVNISKNRTAGSYNLMTAQNPVYIFTMQSGGDEQCGGR